MYTGSGDRYAVAGHAVSIAEFNFAQVHHLSGNILLPACQLSVLFVTGQLDDRNELFGGGHRHLLGTLLFSRSTVC